MGWNLNPRLNGQKSARRESHQGGAFVAIEIAGLVETIQGQSREEATAMELT